MTASGATVVAVVLLAPWSFAVLGGPARWQTLAGVPVASSSGAGWGELLRLAVGPIGDAALAWAFLAAAALPLLIGARTRLAWAGRAWSIAVVAWAVAWLAGRGGLGPVAIAPQVLLVPAGVGIALAVGLGVAAFQLDLPGYRFGWRQAAAVTAAAAAVVGMLPVLVGSLGGRWDLVPSGYGEATTWMAANQAQGDFRVLWLGDPRVLPGNGWELAPGPRLRRERERAARRHRVVAGLVAGPGRRHRQRRPPGPEPRHGAPGSAVGALRGALRRGGRHPGALDPRAADPDLASGPRRPRSGRCRAQIDLRQIISQGGFDVFVDPSRAALAGRCGARAGAPPSPAAAVTGVDHG